MKPLNREPAALILCSLALVSLLASCQSSYDKASQAFQVGDLEKAKTFLGKIPSESKMADSAKLLMDRIVGIEDSTLRFTDSSAYSNGQIALNKKSYSVAKKLLEDVDCRHPRPSEYCDSAKALLPSVNDLIAKEREEKRVQGIIEQLDREIASLRKSRYEKKTSAADIQIAIVLLGAYQKLIDDNRSESDRRIKQKVNTLEYLAKQNRINSLPQMRRDYSKIIGQILWQHDVSVSAFGSGSRILQLTGVIFASNKGIMMVQEALKDTPKLLRYSQVRYKWYDGADKYTYYDLETLRDSDPYKFN